MSETEPVKRGTPQDSILSPLLFSIIINGLSESLSDSGMVISLSLLMTPAPGNQGPIWYCWNNITYGALRHNILERSENEEATTSTRLNSKLVTLVKKSDWHAHSRDLRGPSSTAMGFEQRSTIVVYWSHGPQHIIGADNLAKDICKANPSILAKPQGDMVIMRHSLAHFVATSRKGDNAATAVELGQVETVGSQKLLSERANSLRSIEKLIVYIKLGNDEVCAGVQMSDAWILTLADCVDKNIKLGKYRIIYQDGSKQVIAEDRDSVGEEFVLLQMETTKETKTKFAKLSDSMSPSPDYDYQLYSKDESDEVTANDVVFVSAKKCVKKGIEGNFGVTHKCFQVNMGKTTKCLPGNPIFGSKENKIMLQGLTVASSDSCSSSLYSYASIKPQVSWINTVILDCGSVENIQNGKISLDKKSKTSVGATATIKCDDGYLASQQKITCLNTGKWQKSICTIKECKQCQLDHNRTTIKSGV
ncbi:uncharacterized protein LOC132750896 [Ruditapes philippinarum]|uniref:uncharacterized protein LOC132750896 n=1 Tax=Ruditapes philippinarum TaxID=129788 RepID=UPI00295BF7C8|nr:uncharacterized protein LOC132750896 [Ruditapes philippinarum]